MDRHCAVVGSCGRHAQGCALCRATEHRARRWLHRTPGGQRRQWRGGGHRHQVLCSAVFGDHRCRTQRHNPGHAETGSFGRHRHLEFRRQESGQRCAGQPALDRESGRSGGTTACGNLPVQHQRECGCHLCRQCQLDGHWNGRQHLRGRAQCRHRGTQHRPGAGHCDPD